MTDKEDQMYPDSINQQTYYADYDQGLRQFFLNVFNNMFLGLALSGVTAFLVSSSPELMMSFFGGPQKWFFLLAPLGMALFLGFMINSLSPSTARILLYVYAGLMGISLSSIFLIFKMGSIAQVFFITATTFGATALYGYTTKRDLSAMGSFMIMGVIGLCIAGVVNIFLASSVLQFAISAISVLVFTALTAWDVQSLKDIYYNTEGDDRERAGIIGALNLYMDFLNIFINLLQLIGDRK